MAKKGPAAQELSQIGVPKGEATRLAGLGIRAALEAGAELEEIRGHLRAIVRDPAAVRPHFADFAAAVARERSRFVPREAPAVFRQWGQDLEPQSIEQMQNACRLPIAVRGALMPDAHVGYGLPIGGVLATRGAVVPYAVGVDIACRMKLSVFDLPPQTLATDGERLRAHRTSRWRFHHRRC